MSLLSTVFFICSIDKKDTMMVKDDNNGALLLFFFFLLFFFHALTNNNSYDDVFCFFLFGRGTRRLIVVCCNHCSRLFSLHPQPSLLHAHPHLQQTYIQIDQKPKRLLHIKARDGNASTTKRNIVASIQDAENSYNIFHKPKYPSHHSCVNIPEGSATFNWFKDCWYTKTSTKSNETSHGRRAKEKR